MDSQLLLMDRLLTPIIDYPGLGSIPIPYRLIQPTNLRWIPLPHRCRGWWSALEEPLPSQVPSPFVQTIAVAG